MCNIKLPKLTINSSNAQSFNDKIISENNSDNGCQKNFKGVCSLHIDYRYYLKDNIIFILIIQEINNYRGSGYTKYFGYYYDITNDKELSLEEIYKKYEINLDEVNKKIDIENQNSSEPIGQVNKFDQVIMPTTNNNFYLIYVETTPGTHMVYIYK